MLLWILPGLETFLLLLLLPDKFPTAAVRAAQLLLSKDTFIRGWAAPGDTLVLDKAEIQSFCFCP